MKSGNRSISLYMVGAFVFGLLVIAMYNQYVFFSNSTNHTGAPVRGIGVVYLLLSAWSFVLWRRHNGLFAILCVILGLVGALEIFLLDYLNIMIEYDNWLRKGQPERVYGCWFVDC